MKYNKELTFSFYCDMMQLSDLTQLVRPHKFVLHASLSWAETWRKEVFTLSEKTKEYFLGNIEKQSRLFRTVWRKLQESDLAQHKLNTYLQHEYNIDKRTANTLIQGVKGRLKALKALKEVERANLQTKINTLKKRVEELSTIIKELKKKAENNKLTENQLFSYRNKKRDLWQKKQKVNRLNQEI